MLENRWELMMVEMRAMMVEMRPMMVEMRPMMVEMREEQSVLMMVGSWEVQ